MTIFLLNGWRCPATLLHPLADALSADGYPVIQVPPVPEQAWHSPIAWQAWVAQWYEPGGCLIGWSLGGTLAWQVAQQQGNARALFTLGTAPQFISQLPGCGLDVETFARFYALAEAQPAVCLRRFQALLVQGDEQQAELRRHLRYAFADDERMTSGDLAGLQHLAQTDLALVELPSACVRAHWFGAVDSLMPAAMARHLPNSRVFQGVGHCLPLRLIDEITAQVGFMLRDVVPEQDINQGHAGHRPSRGAGDDTCGETL